MNILVDLLAILGIAVTLVVASTGPTLLPDLDDTDETDI